MAALTRAARPLRTTEPSGPFTDLRPFGRSVGGAPLVGLGDGTSSPAGSSSPPTSGPGSSSGCAPTTRAYELLAAQRPAPDPIDLHSALAISQETRFYAYGDSDEEASASLEYRDRTMAANVAWWYHLTGSRTVVSAHNSHVAYRDTDPDFTRMGGYLRRWFGPDHTNLRTGFYRGSFNSTYETDTGIGVGAYTVGPPPPDFNEYTLGAVPHARYFLDLRTLPSPAGRWAAQSRLHRFFGGFWQPTDIEEITLGTFSDMLIFLHRSTAARMLPGTPT